MNIYNLIVYLILVIDPSLLNGKWEIVTFPGYEKVISSSRNQGMEADEYLKMLNNYNLYMDSTYYRFSNDTVYFTNLEEGKIKSKLGKWYLDNDTLIINDLEKIATYRYLITKLDDQEFLLKSILRNGVIANSPRTFKRSND